VTSGRAYIPAAARAPHPPISLISRPLSRMFRPALSSALRRAAPASVHAARFTPRIALAQFRTMKTLTEAIKEDHDEVRALRLPPSFIRG
jgi:hypothetical protein